MLINARYGMGHHCCQSPEPEKGNFMSYRTVISIAAAAVLGIACVSTDALAYRGGGRGGRIGGVHAGGARVGGVYRGGGYRGGYGRGGVGVGVGIGVGAAAVGAAAVAPRYYNGVGCGYYPYRPC
jgi:hypothetical protein